MKTEKRKCPECGKAIIGSSINKFCLECNDRKLDEFIEEIEADEQDDAPDYIGSQSEYIF